MHSSRLTINARMQRRPLLKRRKNAAWQHPAVSMRRIVIIVIMQHVLSLAEAADDCMVGSSSGVTQ